MRRHERHGFRGTTEYSIWLNMKQRCLNPKNKAFAHYGGRGISVCESWKNSFSSFLDYVGPRPPGLTIDRIDNNGNYEPGNVQWATAKTQTENRRSTRLLTYKGMTLPMLVMARHLGVNQWGFRSRIDKGDSVEEALASMAHVSKIRASGGINTKTRLLTCDGVTLPMMTMACHFGINKWAFRNAISKGVAVEEAVALGRARKQAVLASEGGRAA